MSRLKLYYDTLSQPARAVKLFLLVNKIPHEAITVKLGKGEHFQPEFKKINPLSKVPVLEHNGFILTESVAILRYLCREYDVPDHWYPKDSRLQARVDEYLEWQHTNTRTFAAMYFRFKVLHPKFMGEEYDESKVQYFYNGLQGVLKSLSNHWLKDKKYLCGDEISIADLLGVSELEQPRMAGYDVGKDYPIVKAYMERVRADLQPHYNDVMTRFNRFMALYVDNENLTAKL